MRAKASSRKVHICSICQKVFDTELGLERHSKSYPDGHVREKVTDSGKLQSNLKCDESGEVYPQDNSMKRRSIPPEAEGGSPARHQLLKIPYVLLEDALSSHYHKTYISTPEEDIKSAQSDNTTKFQCSKCDKSFRIKKGLDSHICPVEKSDPAAPKKSDNDSPNSGKRKSSVADINAKVAKTDSEELSAASAVKIFTCQECFKEFSFKTGLNLHLISHKKNTKPESRAIEQKETGTNEQTTEEHTLAIEDESTERIATAIGTDSKGAQDDQTAEYQNIVRECEGGPSLTEVVAECIGGDGVVAIPGEKEFEVKQEFETWPMLQTSPKLDTDENADVESGLQASENKSPKNRNLKDVISKWFACEFCDDIFSQKLMLEAHIEALHSGRKFSCEQCGIEFKRKSNLVRHTSRTHCEPSFKCNQCSKAFLIKYDLERHLKTHSVKKNSTGLIHCIECGEVFVYKKDLKIHRRQIHKVVPQITDEPPVVIPDFVIREHGQAVSVYRCSLCPRAFSLKTDLQRHFLVHSGEKPFACEICDASFNRKSNLVRHKRLMHQVTEERAMRVKMNAEIIRRKKKEHFELEPWEEEIRKQDEQVRLWMNQEEVREWENELQDPSDDEKDEIRWEQEADDAGDENEESQSIEVTFFQPDEKITVRILTFE